MRCGSIENDNHSPMWCQFTVSIAYKKMLLKVAKIVLAIALSFTFTISLWKIIICVHESYFDEFNINAVDNWLEENDLGDYKQLFRDMGE
jgi:hypothetical protein